MIVHLKFSFLALVAGLLAGCAAGNPPPSPGSSLVHGMDPLPWSDIEAILNPRQRSTLESLKYTAYVILDGWIEEDGHVRLNRTRQSFPDHTRDQLALAFGRKAVIHTPTSASKINPTVTVYVIFYDNAIEGQIALTFAKRSAFSGTGHFGEDYYLDIAQY